MKHGQFWLDHVVKIMDGKDYHSLGLGQAVWLIDSFIGQNVGTSCSWKPLTHESKQFQLLWGKISFWTLLQISTISTSIADINDSYTAYRDGCKTFLTFNFVWKVLKDYFSIFCNNYFMVDMSSNKCFHSSISRQLKRSVSISHRTQTHSIWYKDDNVLSSIYDLKESLEFRQAQKTSELVIEQNKQMKELSLGL